MPTASPINHAKNALDSAHLFNGHWKVRPRRDEYLQDTADSPKQIGPMRGEPLPEALFALLAGTGLRIGEALGLKLGDHLFGDSPQSESARAFGVAPPLAIIAQYCDLEVGKAFRPLGRLFRPKSTKQLASLAFPVRPIR